MSVPIKTQKPGDLKNLPDAPQGPASSETSSQSPELAWMPLCKFFFFLLYLPIQTSPFVVVDQNLLQNLHNPITFWVIRNRIQSSLRVSPTVETQRCSPEDRLLPRRSKSSPKSRTHTAVLEGFPRQHGLIRFGNMPK